MYLHVTHFHRKENRWQSVCKECQLTERANREGHERLVLVAPYHKWLEEITWRCGSYQNAARTMGIPQTTLLRWLGRERESVRRIRRSSARRIIATLHGLRDGSIQPNYRSRGNTRVFRKGCKGCGILNLDEYTEGCYTCRERAYGRKKREAA